VGQNSDTFDVVVKLLLGESFDDRRNIAEGAVAVFFGEVDIDLELDFEFDRGGVEEDLVGGNRFC